MKKLLKLVVAGALAAMTFSVSPSVATQCPLLPYVVDDEAECDSICAGHGCNYYLVGIRCYCV
jgi:hypothetical protein